MNNSDVTKIKKQIDNLFDAFSSKGARLFKSENDICCYLYKLLTDAFNDDEIEIHTEQRSAYYMSYLKWKNLGIHQQPPDKEHFVKVIKNIQSDLSLSEKECEGCFAIAIPNKEEGALVKQCNPGSFDLIVTKKGKIICAIELKIKYEEGSLKINCPRIKFKDLYNDFLKLNVLSQEEEKKGNPIFCAILVLENISVNSNERTKTIQIEKKQTETLQKYFKDVTFLLKRKG